jgi:S-DNA-T family DNA segregation ATPase FtsK/SpoIIIE
LPDGLRDFFAHALRTLLGGAVMLLALALALALLSYAPADASWNAADSGHALHNWLGKTGSYGADAIWQSFGLAGFVPVVVLAAWAWRILSDRELDKMAWRVLSALAAMLLLAMCAAMLAFKLPPDMPALDGAFGRLLGGALLSALPPGWGRYVLAPVLLILGIAALYMAASLSLGEWHVMARALRQTIWWIARQARFVGVSFWRILNNDKTGARDDEEEIEDEDEEDEAKIEKADDETDETEEEAKPGDKPAPRRVKARAPLIKRPAASARQARLALRAEGEHPLPPLDFLQWPDEGRPSATTVSEEALEKNAKLLESVLADFGVNGTISKVSPGPVVTLYELEPSPGTRAARVVSLADDIARNMSVTSVRVATVPGRNVIGIELPNARRETVYLRELLQSDAYNDTRATLPLVLGKDIAGGAVIADLARMPHLLIAGTTGSGKSVAINTMILSLLYRMPPQKCRFIMIDPKMLELSVYEGIPHLLAPVVTDPKKAIMALRWTVREMEERYRAMSKLGVRNIDGYNMRLRDAVKNGENLMRTVQTGFDRETGKPIYEEQPLDLTELPYIVVIVDEMADLMIVAGKEIESAIQRLAQMARGFTS